MNSVPVNLKLLSCCKLCELSLNDVFHLYFRLHHWNNRGKCCTVTDILWRIKFLSINMKDSIQLKDSLDQTLVIFLILISFLFEKDLLTLSKLLQILVDSRLIWGYFSHNNFLYHCLQPSCLSNFFMQPSS